jgi:superfamily I DNA/RNA helicase
MISLDDLNPQQREAVRTVEGPVLVLSGAGTGKTRTITYRIAHMLQQGIACENILAVTFTNKAAREMRERVRALVGKRAQQMQVSTFHSLGARMLREHAAALGLRPHFSIYDGGEQIALVKKALRGISVTWKKYKPDDVLYRLHAARHWRDDALHLRDGDGVDGAVLQSVWETYRSALRSANAVDFEDLLFLPLRLLHTHKDVTRQYRERFRYILVDEYQDTNSTQFDLLHLLAGAHRNICVVGDDDQSIYGWRGAEVRNILDFEKHFAQAKVIRLEENYRSTATILDAANAVISKNTERKSKRLWTKRRGGDTIRCMAAVDEMDEAELVVADLLMQQREHRLPPSAFAILMRMNTQARPFEEVLRRYKVPYVVVGGMQFYDRKEIKDFLCYLRILVNPHDDEALLRIINVPPRALGETSIERLGRAAAHAHTALEPMLAQAEEIADLQPAARHAMAQLGELFDSHRASLATQSPASVARALWAAVDYRRELETSSRTPQEVDERMANVQALLDSIAYYEQHTSSPTLAGFLQQIALLNNDDDEELSSGKVAVMTVHAAKGLEFPCVYIVGAQQGIMPHAKSAVSANGMAEERRLFYVAVTRARDRLMITYPLTRMRYGALEQCKPSEFLDDIPAALMTWDRQAQTRTATQAEAAGFVAQFKQQLGA